MANGANRLFNVIKNTSESTNVKPSELVSLTVKSLNPIVFNKDDKLDVPEEFCVFNNNIDKSKFQIGDTVSAFVFNEGQLYFIQQTDNGNASSINYNNVYNKPKINNVELVDNKTLEELDIPTENQIKQLIENYILEDNKKKYYIGKIIMETENVNPATYLGFGTWQLWGAGRVPVGIDITQTEFNTVEKTGGEKTHTLTIEEMPSHNHDLAMANSGTSYMEYAGYSDGQNVAIRNVAIKNTGGGQSHNILQPYIVCYMWKRIA